MSNLKEAIVFAVIGLLVFLALFDVTAFVVDENLAAEYAIASLNQNAGTT